MAQSFSFEQVYKAAMVVTNENYDRVDYADLNFLFAPRKTRTSRA